MPLTKKQLVIHTSWKNDISQSVEKALADLPECRIVSMQTQGYFLFLVVEFV
jgi:hypothetical protein